MPNCPRRRTVESCESLCFEDEEAELALSFKVF